MPRPAIDHRSDRLSVSGARVLRKRVLDHLDGGFIIPSGIGHTRSRQMLGLLRHRSQWTSRLWRAHGRSLGRQPTVPFQPRSAGCGTMRQDHALWA
jgi:hypothetical protein